MDLASTRIVYLTSGAAGMYCGSCLRDNTLASALQEQGIDVLLIPTYTPIRTDEEDVSVNRVFFGGVNVYLQQHFPLFRRLPRFLTSWMDHPALIRRLPNHRFPTDSKLLGQLAVSMLRGEAGNQSAETSKLADWLDASYRPNLINLSNILIAGCVPELKARFNVPIIVTLQGDDLFVDNLPEPYRSQVHDKIKGLVSSIDGFVVFSKYYAEAMADYFHIPTSKIRCVPLGINVDGFPVKPPTKRKGPMTVGYFARVCEAKGLHLLVDAFLELRRQTEFSDLRLKTGGWLSATDKAYAEGQFAKLRRENSESAFDHVGVLNRREKIDFLRSLDIFSVPTTYREPKGIFVLEALACGVPVVQPNHGAFPELLLRTDGGQLCSPNDSQDLARVLRSLLTNSELRQKLGREGQIGVHRKCSAAMMAKETWKVYEEFLAR